MLLAHGRSGRLGTPRPKHAYCATCHLRPWRPEAAPACGGHTKRIGRDPLGGKSRQRHQSRWPGDGRDDKLVEVVEDCSGEKLGERAMITLIRASKRREVARAIALVDDRRGIAEPDQQQVEDEAASTAVTVQKRVDLLER
jgi:hypothetical protein